METQFTKELRIRRNLRAERGKLDSVLEEIQDLEQRGKGFVSTFSTCFICLVNIKIKKLHFFYPS